MEEERISMSIKELRRLEELKEAHDKRQTLVEAAANMGVSLRHAKRLSKGLKLNGPNGTPILNEMRFSSTRNE